MIWVKEDDCYMTATNFNGVYIVGKRKPDADDAAKRKARAKRVANAVKRMSEYKKK